jgi:hypothetical protein
VKSGNSVSVIRWPGQSAHGMSPEYVTAAGSPQAGGSDCSMVETQPVINIATAQAMPGETQVRKLTLRTTLKILSSRKGSRKPLSCTTDGGVLHSLA